METSTANVSKTENYDLSVHNHTDMARREAEDFTITHGLVQLVEDPTRILDNLNHWKNIFELYPTQTIGMTFATFTNALIGMAFGSKQKIHQALRSP